MSEQVTEGTGEATSTTEGTGAPAGGTGEQTAGAEPTSATRPEWLPEKFWDGEAGAPRTEQLAKSYGELEQFRSSRTQNVPERYELPGTLKGFEDQVPECHLETLQALAREEGFSQAGYDHLAKAVLGDMAGGMAKLRERYGDETEKTLEAVGSFGQGLGEEHAAAVRLLTSRPEGVMFLDHLRREGAAASIPGEVAAAGGSGTVSKESLESLMADPRYWRDKDPKFLAEVTEGFKRLYPGQTPAAQINPGEPVR